ncbi:putative ribonuclease H [Triangularia setosa]|uniref:Ribonuclease H n=1 Tax=Triangularia setosa TaxID=2587417 RepID=A0AAN6W3I1_9PEZI|nr:putative ribonuclease H [Podospora setosa]
MCSFISHRQSQESSSRPHRTMVTMAQPAIFIALLFPSNTTPLSKKKLARRSRVRPASVFHPGDPALPPEAHFPLQTIHVPDRPVHPASLTGLTAGRSCWWSTGRCINNGRHADKSQPPIGISSFKFKNSPGVPGTAGDVVDHTSNRAKLRAVIAALQFRAWHEEGWRRVVILTDLEYIVKGEDGGV